MDKIKSFKRNSSLRRSLALYVAVFAALAIILSAATASLCDGISSSIRASYPTSGEKYYLTNERGEQLGDGVSVVNGPVVYSERDERAAALLQILPVIAASFYSGLCIIAAAFLFYRNKLKRPLAELRAASEKISDNDLDFTIRYDSNDELGQLCGSFELMRTTLSNNFSEMWRQVEERKQVNAAFAHDLRTPLTVLKGYNEMLQASDDPQTRNTAVTMEKHISRMEAYISEMSNLRRLEDAKPECKTVSVRPFLSALCESAEIVCGQNGKTLYRQNSIPDAQVSVDADFVSQVSNNLISNAARYAENAVTLSVELHDSGLRLSVTDDGKGFEKDALSKASDPYFTEEADRSEHFGLGLYICKLLCERHDGFLQIENISGGAKVTAFFKFSPL